MTHRVNRFMLTNSSPRRLSLIMIGFVLVVDLAWLPFSALSFGTGNLAVIMVIAGLFFLAGPVQRRFRVPAMAENLAVDLYILVLFGVVGFVFSYLTIESGWTIRDEWFVAIDKTLGFDWRTYTAFFLQHDLLRSVSLILYVLSPLLVGFALFWNCLHGNFDRASELVAMVILGGVLCVVMSGLVPSAGGAGYFGADGDFYRDYRVVFDSSYKLAFCQLRDGTGMDIFLLRPLALIAFPSYHACLSMQVILVFRDKGLLGFVIIALNVGSMLSLPVQGGHHLSDVLGGLLTGAVVYWAVRKYAQAQGHQ